MGRKINQYYEMTREARNKKEGELKAKDIQPNDGRRILEDVEIVLDALRDGIPIHEILECARKCNVFIPSNVLDEAFEQWKVERDMKNRNSEDER